MTNETRIAQLVLQLVEQIAALSERVDQLEQGKPQTERVYAGRPTERRPH